MKDLNGKVAVVTGAARGIGFALCQEFANAGMKIVMSDIDSNALAESEQKIQGSGVETLAVPVDVSKLEQVQDLADKTTEHFGKIHILCNNAGIFGRPAYMWEQSQEEWERGLNINLWGAINGLRVFTPIMLGQGAEAHIVNVASVAGHLVQPFMTPYHASKFAVAAVTESLYHELRLLGSKIGVTLLCPGFTQTEILRNSDNRNEALSDPDRMAFIQSSMESGIKGGLSAEEVALQTINAIRDKRFYVFPTPHTLDMIRVRFDGILQQANPDMDEEVKQRFAHS